MIAAVIVLVLFAFSFAISFFLLTSALNSLGADFDNTTYSCEIDNIYVNRELECANYANRTSPCINVTVRCEGFTETKTMYEHYQNYFRSEV